MSSGDSRINRVLDRLATLNVLTVRVVAIARYIKRLRTS